MDHARILLISTGGTIAMTSSDSSGITPKLSGEDLVRAVPQLADMADITVSSYSTKPGASLTLDDLISIAAQIDEGFEQGIAGAIVVQGTDTIEDTAFVLDLLVATPRPVVVVGAMRGAAAPGADGPANLLSAVVVALSPAAAPLGVVAVLNDEVHAARYVQKSHTGLPSAFTSSGLGPVGRVIEEQFQLYMHVVRTQPLKRPEKAGIPPVALITTVLDDDGRLLPVLPGLGYCGAVVAGMGAGHFPTWHAQLLSDLADHMPVVYATRVAGGPVFTRTYGFTGSEMDCIKRGLIPAGNLSGVKACLLLRLLLASGLSGEELKAEFIKRSRNYRTE